MFFDSENFPDTDCNSDQAANVWLFYDKLGVQNYNSSLSGRRNVVCDWTGITCDSNDKVVEIKLGERYLFCLPLYKTMIVYLSKPLLSFTFSTVTNCAF